jgi:hypothetical protein
VGHLNSQISSNTTPRSMGGLEMQTGRFGQLAAHGGRRQVKFRRAQAVIDCLGYLNWIADTPLSAKWGAAPDFALGDSVGH